MQKEPGYILRDERLFNKFCAKENKVFGCQNLYGCSIACPLYRAKMVEYLYNEKSMTIGDAHKACLRKDLTGPEVMSCLRALVKTGDKTISMDVLMQILEKKNE